MKLKYFFQRIKCLLSNRHFLFFFIKISSIKLICFVFFIQIFSMQRNIFCVAGGALWSVRRPGRQTQLLRGSRLSLLQGFLQEVRHGQSGDLSLVEIIEILCSDWLRLWCCYALFCRHENTAQGTRVSM